VSSELAACPLPQMLRLSRRRHASQSWSIVPFRHHNDFAVRTHIYLIDVFGVGIAGPILLCLFHGRAEENDDRTENRNFEIWTCSIHTHISFFTTPTPSQCMCLVPGTLRAITIGLMESQAWFFLLSLDVVLLMILIIGCRRKRQSERNAATENET
jgi:hypothetical protein